MSEIPYPATELFSFLEMSVQMIVHARKIDAIRVEKFNGKRKGIISSNKQHPSYCISTGRFMVWGPRHTIHYLPYNLGEPTRFIKVGQSHVYSAVGKQREPANLS